MTMEYYEELRKIHQDIRTLAKTLSEEEKASNNNSLQAAVKLICSLSHIARKEGLLALEEAVENIEIVQGQHYLKSLIMLIVDGTDSADVKNIGLTRYFCSLVYNYEALIYLIHLEGVLSIQAGENPRLLEEKVKVLLPTDVLETYCLEQEKEQKKVMKQDAENIIERLCSGKRFWNPTDSGYFVMKLADYVICDITDKEMERLLREIDNMDLAVAMKGLSGDARRHIFSCLSERLGKMVAEDMEQMGAIRAVDVLSSAQKIIMVFIHLIEKGEIIDRYEYLVPFYDIFHVDVEKEHNKSVKFEELKRFMNEYEEKEQHKVE